MKIFFYGTLTQCRGKTKNFFSEDHLFVSEEKGIKCRVRCEQQEMSRNSTTARGTARVGARHFTPTLRTPLLM